VKTSGPSGGIRVLSYNIHKGFNTGNAKFVLHHIKEAIQLIDADIVFLQEVLGQHSRHELKWKNWPLQPQFEFLADSLWPHFAYGKNAIYSSGHHGNVIMSKYPIIGWENLDISAFSLEKRGLLHGIIEVPKFKEPFHAICVHLSLLERSRNEQIGKLCRRISDHVPHGAPLLIAGDFNDWRQNVSVTLKNELGVDECFIQTRGNHAKTFPSWFPFLALDRIYFRGFDLSEAQCLTGRPWRDLSDHAALYAKVIRSRKKKSRP